MHELSIACSIVEIVEENLGSPESRAVRICLRIGRLAGVDRDALEFGFEAATADTRAEGAILEIEEVDVVVRCGSCARESSPDTIPVLRCAHCGELAGEVLQGRELDLVSIEIDDGKSADC